MNYPIRLICIDVDGTLVNQDKILLEDNIKAIRWAHLEKGVHIAICSGRIETSVRHYMQMLGIKDAIPSLGGGLVREYDGRIIQDNRIDQTAALGIYDIAEELGSTYFYYHHDEWCIGEGHDYWRLKEQNATGLTGEVADIPAKILQNGPNKILGASTDPKLTIELKRRIEEKYSDKVDCFPSTLQFLEVLPKGIHKGTAVDALCKYYGIKRENVMAIGDYYNDVDMLKVVGLPVAMANAPQDIKAIAAYSTEADNNHCGVAEAIARFIV